MTKARDIANAGTALATVDATELEYLDGVTSAIQTQVDAKIGSTIVDAKGDIVAASADNTPARLAVGANGTVLTADSAETTGLKWATSGGGMTLLSTTTLSGASTSISITPTGYTQLLIYVYGLTASGTCNLFMGINNDTTAANYQQWWTGTSGTLYHSGANVGVAGVNGILPAINGPLSTGGANFWQYTIFGPDITKNKAIESTAAFFSDSSVNAGSSTNCNYVTTSTVTSIQLKTTVNSFTGGTVLVYGVK